MTTTVKSYVKQAVLYGPECVVETAQADKRLSDDEKAAVAEQVAAIKKAAKKGRR